eukprot:GHVU01022698.1.p1 GENE.GHVU01022698.1~~GHVU01022698.1.p1  ORF type:complete len:129 (-),score=19.67 GHVU01022698.1:657-1043(-)
MRSEIREVALGGNPIGPEGGVAILRGVRLCATLTTLDLSQADLDDSKEIADCLCITMPNNKALVNYDFSGNNFGEENSRIVFEVAKTCKHLKSFKFSERISKELAAAFNVINGKKKAKAKPSPDAKAK